MSSRGLCQVHACTREKAAEYKKTVLRQVVYMNSSMSDDDLIEYYRSRLAAQDWTVDAIDHTSAGGQRFDFGRSGVAGGYVSATGDKDSMARKYQNVFSRRLQQVSEVSG